MDFKYQFFRFHEDIDKWAKENYKSLCTLSSPNMDLTALKTEYNYWYEKLLSDYKFYSEVKDFPDGIRYMQASFIFVELSRSFFLFNYAQVIKESAILKVNENAENLLITWKFNQTKHFESLNITWDKPVFRFTQTEIITGILMLTEHLNLIPYEGLADLKEAVKILYLRNAIFFCEEMRPEMLDSTEEFITKSPTGNPGMLTPNREYQTFCTIYFHAVFRRIFYGELIAPLNHKLYMNEAIERCKKWIAEEVCPSLGIDGFEALYDKSYEEAYQFPGDLEWFKYRYPDQATYIGPILDCFRKEYSKKYYGEHRTSIESVLGTFGLNNHTGLCSYYFIINAVNQYFKTSCQFDWRECVFVDNDALEASEKQILRSKVPYMVQYFSKYYCFDKEHDKIYISDCIYSSIVYWMYILKVYYSGYCLTYNCNEIIEKIIDGKVENKIVFF